MHIKACVYALKYTCCTEPEVLLHRSWIIHLFIYLPQEQQSQHKQTRCDTGAVKPQKTDSEQSPARYWGFQTEPAYIRHNWNLISSDQTGVCLVCGHGSDSWPCDMSDNALEFLWLFALSWLLSRTCMCPGAPAPAVATKTAKVNSLFFFFPPEQHAMSTSSSVLLLSHQCVFRCRWCRCLMQKCIHVSICDFSEDRRVLIKVIFR